MGHCFSCTGDGEQVRQAQHTVTPPITPSHCILRVPMIFQGQANLLHVSKYLSVSRVCYLVTQEGVVNKPGSFALSCLAASQILRHWGLQQRKSLFARQPSKETEEQVSYLPPQRWGAWGIYGTKKQGGLRHGERGLEVEKKGNWCSVQTYLGYMLLRGIHVQKWRHFAWSEGGVLGPLTSKSHSLDNCTDPVLGSVVPISLGWLELCRSWLQFPGK